MAVSERLRQFLEAESNARPVWRDGGEAIAFLSTRDGAMRVWETTLAGGEYTRLSDGDERIWTIMGDAATGTVLYCMDQGGNEQEQIFAISPGCKPRNITNAPQARHYLGGVRAGGRWAVYASNVREAGTFDLWQVDMHTGEKQLLLQNSDQYNIPAWQGVSPDGRYVLYNKLKGASDNALWMLDIETGKARPVPGETTPAQFIHPVWRPDSSGFYLISDLDSEFCYAALYDLTTGAFTRVYETTWDVEALALAGDGRTLALTVNREGWSEIVVLDLPTGQRVETAMPPKGVISPYGTFSFSPEGRRLLFSHTSGQRPENVWVLDLDHDLLRRVTDGRVKGVAPEEMAEPELHRFASFDGLSVPFWLYRPLGKATGALPVVIEIHGGPEGQELPSYNAFLQYLLSRGIGVVAPNIRGSMGYGKAYHHLDDVEKRLDSVEDIKALVAYLLEKGIAQPWALAVMGASYGGFMTLSCAARLPELWACAVDIVGMYNLESFLENTAPYRRKHREAEYGSLEHHREILRAVSPIAKTGDITAPLMVIHGANDPRVPVSEAEQVVAALKARGLPVRYLRYEDEGHGIAKLKNKLDCYPQIADFLDDHLLP